MSGADLTLQEAADAIREGRVTPLELVEACLERLARSEPEVHAFVEVDVDRARRAAEALTAELSRRGPRGPLHGIPLGVKDVVDVAGLPTRAGSRVTDGGVARRDAPVVARLRASGAVVLGKTSTHEFAHGVESPPTRNPWDPGRIPGGSSGGSAAAVAVGSCLGAVGTDSGGSIRIPAALCGVSGLRPRPRAAPMAGVVPFSTTHDTVGPLARSAGDLAVLWSAMSGMSTRAGPATPGRLLLGVPDDLPRCQMAVLAAFDRAVEILRGEGAAVREVRVPPFAAWEGPRTVVVMAEFLAAHQRAGWYPYRADRYGDDVRTYLERADRMPPRTVRAARRRLAELRRAFRSALRAVDALLLPTTVRTAPPVRPGGVPPGGLRKELVRELVLLTAPVSSSGLAAASVPCGWDPGGLPIGLQIVGRDEATVLSTAELYQAVTDHHRARPPLGDG
ncbi:MAG TPA: amidase [Actinomycetota bacterium]|nr:amidase [Actinomycetota bacterium]